MQGAEPGDEVAHGAQHQPQFPESGVRSLEEDLLLGAGRFAGRDVLQARESLHRRCAPSVPRRCNKAAVRLSSAACGTAPVQCERRRTPRETPRDRETFPGGRTAAQWSGTSQACR